MAAADKNVRPKRQAPAVTARGARRSGLARLLLQLLELLQLDRKLLLLLAASLMPACIIPVGPNWQDPPGARNSPPTTLSVFPPEGSKVVGSANGNVFSVTPTDNDVGDNLWVRWITEFPPFIEGVTQVIQTDPIPASTNGAPLAVEKSFTITCPYLSASLTTHQIMAAIADAEFISSDNPADVLKTKNGVSQHQVVWTLEKACSASP